MIDYKTARANMVESQIRPNSVTDRRLIDAFADVPREVYVPWEYQSMAYMDEDIPIRQTDGTLRFLVNPMIQARLFQLAEIGPGDVVLDVGCGLGYSSAILARLAEAVVSLECDEDMAARANDTLSEQDVDNAAVVTGALAAGYESQGPYDVIVLNGSVPSVPQPLLDQLNDSGRLVAVISEGALGRAHLYIRNGALFAQRTAFDATIPPLPGFAAAEPAFVF